MKEFVPYRRGRPLGRWKDRVEEFLGERGINEKGVLEEARRKGWDKGGDSSVGAIPWRDVPGE